MAQESGYLLWFRSKPKLSELLLPLITSGRKKFVPNKKGYVGIGSLGDVIRPTFLMELCGVVGRRTSLFLRTPFYSE